MDEEVPVSQNPINLSDARMMYDKTFGRTDFVHNNAYIPFIQNLGDAVKE